MGFEDFHKRRTTIELNVEKEQASHFDEQWNNPIQLKVGEETFDVHDVHPEEEKSGVPVLVVPGWGHTPDVWMNNMRQLVSSGRHTLSVDAPHGSDEQIEMKHVMPEAESRRMTPFLRALESRGIDKADVIAHSEGCIDTLLAAREFPERFRTIVLVNPGGMIGEDSFPQLAVRFAADNVLGALHAARQGALSRLSKGGRSAVSSAVSGPVLAFKEVRAIASTQVDGILRDLKTKGINIVIIHGVSDGVFPIERMRGQLQDQKKLQAGESGGQPDIMKILDGVYAVNGHHEDFILHPETYTRLAEGAISALEVRDAKRAEGVS